MSAEPEPIRWHRQTLWIGEHRIDLGRRTVFNDDGPIRLPPKAVAVLIALARQQGQTVSREELLDQVWKNRFTTPDVVSQAVSSLRRAFGDDPAAPVVIETISRLGYRLLPPARFEDNREASLIGSTDERVEEAPEASETPMPNDTNRSTAARNFTSFYLAILAIAVLLTAAVAVMR